MTSKPCIHSFCHLSTKQVLVLVPVFGTQVLVLVLVLGNQVLVNITGNRRLCRFRQQNHLFQLSGYKV